MRPLHRRDIVRIELLLAGVIAQIVLVPLAGVGWAMLIGIGGTMLIFLLSPKLIDQ